MKKRHALPVLIAALGLSACASLGSATSPPSASASATPTSGTLLDLPVAASVAALEFTNQDGQHVSLASLHGHYVVLTDFLSLCQEICPLASANISMVQKKLAAAGLSSQVDLVEITVDPQRDTPARLKAYQGLFGAAANWQFLTGTSGQVAALWQALGVSYQKVGEDPGVKAIDWLTGKALTYDVNHQDVVFVLGPDGHERWLIQGLPAAGASAIPTKLQAFLNASGRANLASPAAGAWTPGDLTGALSYLLGRSI